MVKNTFQDKNLKQNLKIKTAKHKRIKWRQLLKKSECSFVKYELISFPRVVSGRRGELPLLVTARNCSLWKMRRSRHNSCAGKISFFTALCTDMILWSIQTWCLLSTNSTLSWNSHYLSSKEINFNDILDHYIPPHPPAPRPIFSASYCNFNLFKQNSCLV